MFMQERESEGPVQCYCMKRVKRLTLLHEYVHVITLHSPQGHEKGVKNT
jgi:hypothetical protein